jgi:PPM family protein phosphatase
LSSFISRLFHKKDPEDMSPPRKDPGEAAHKKGGIGTETALEDKAFADLLLKSNLDLPQFVVGAAHSTGLQRDHNEDALFTLTTTMVVRDNNVSFGLYTVADGMGGHENGEIASSIAIDRLTAHITRSLYLPMVSPLTNKMEMSIQEIMQTGVLQAHQAIKKEAPGSGTTLTSVLILGDKLTIAHVGDSRAYLINPDGDLKLLTHDHTLVKRLVEIGQISAEQALTHPDRNILYRALGQGEPFEADIVTFQLLRGSQIMICSDGLWGVIADKDMQGVIQNSADPMQACQTLINLANAAGGPDNISVIIVQIPG